MPSVPCSSNTCSESDALHLRRPNIHRVLVLLLATGCFIAAMSRPLAAQANTVPGLTAALTDASGLRILGRRGLGHPGGEVAIAFSTTTCNLGTANIQWDGPMAPRHPVFAFSIVREIDGRLEQISDPDAAFVKHAFGVGLPSSCGGPCQPTGLGLGPNCSDVYNAFTNGNRFFLGPRQEVDPWLGIWEPVGSYFDRGDPDVGLPGNSDGQRSLFQNSANFPTDPVQNRLAVGEADLVAADRLWFCCQIVVRGEDGDLRRDNLGYREFTADWAEPNWTLTEIGAWRRGSVLENWNGAVVETARNGEDDGHFFVASHVTQLGPTTWRYDYAAQNFDNARGAAALRIPLCAGASLANVRFRDANANALDDWTHARVGPELAFLAGPTNPLDWHSFYSFSFETDVPPSPGEVTLDQARIGPGALAVSLPAPVPAPAARITFYGAGCGSPHPVLSSNGPPRVPTPGFALKVATVPHAPGLLLVSLGADSIPLGNGCVQHLESTVLITHGFFAADPNGIALSPFPIPNDPVLEGLRLYWQAARIVAGGPMLGAASLSNGLELLLSCR
ncbi:MAG: hypothetical protein NXI31_17045 [bacterium]|nr:hypothetical protein [bacterium]